MALLLFTGVLLREFGLSQETFGTQLTGIWKLEAVHRQPAVTVEFRGGGGPDGARPHSRLGRSRGIYGYCPYQLPSP